MRIGWYPQLGTVLVATPSEGDHMISDIIGEWEVTVVDRGGEAFAGRIAFLLNDDKVVVRDADPEVTARPARVEIDGETIRFELLSAGSSRGSTHHNYELRMQGADEFAGTRRRGMLARVPIIGRRVEVAPLAEADAFSALAQAEAEVVAALEAARRAAERAAAARAAVPSAEASVQPTVPPVVLATLPAPTAPPASVPVAVPPVVDVPPAPVPPAPVPPAPVAPVPVAPASAPAPGAGVLRISHRLTRGEIVVLAAEIHPQVYVWGGSYAAADPRLREAGWQIVEIDSDETTHVDETLIRHAATVRETVAG